MSWTGAARDSAATSATSPATTEGQYTPFPLPGSSTAAVSTPAEQASHRNTAYESGAVAHPVDAYSSPPQPPPIEASTQQSEQYTAVPYSHLPPPPTDPHLSYTVPTRPTQYNAPSQPHHPTYPSKEMGYGYQPSPYTGTMTQTHDNGKIVGGPTAGVNTRHALMAIHFVLTVLIVALTGYFLEDLLLLCVEGALVLSFLVYIPAAFGLTVARRRNHFDHAGGKVAYLVVQQFGYLVIGIINVLYVTLTECSARRRVYREGSYSWVNVYLSLCRWATVVLGLSFTHVLFLMGWMIWVIVVVYRRSPADPNRGFQISTGWLLRGWRA